MSLSPQGWHRADIMAALRKQGTSLAELARVNRFARCTMSWALMKPHPRANAAISSALDVPLHTLWPDWYDADGALIFQRIASPSSKKSQPALAKTAPHSAPDNAAVSSQRANAAARRKAA